MTPQEFPAYCPRGHRIVPSTGECYGVREVRAPWVETWGSGPYFEYVTGDCSAVSAAEKETAA